MAAIVTVPAATIKADANHSADHTAVTDALTAISVLIRTGAVDPEAAEVAVVGAIYLRTDNGTMYVKKTGTGNTGWKLVTQAA